MREVPDAKGNGVEIDAAVWDGVEVFGTGFEPAETAALFESAFSGAPFAFGEHVWVDIRHYGFEARSFLRAVQCCSVLMLYPPFPRILSSQA